MAILGGTVIDGTGKPGRNADVALQGDRIVQVGQVGKGKALREISAAGAVVTPGFIDTHSHSDLMVLAEPALLPKLMQGITTELLGQDGIGAALLKTRVGVQIIGAFQTQAPGRILLKIIHSMFREVFVQFISEMQIMDML